MLSKEELQKMMNTEITTLDLSQLEDICEVKIDPGAPDTDRMDSFLKQIKNPYAYRVGDTPVRIRFKKEKPHIKKVLEDYFTHNK